MYGVTRALVFGSYAEASPDVHHLIDALATQRAGRSWRLMGARTAAEARGYFVSRMRRAPTLAEAMRSRATGRTGCGQGSRCVQAYIVHTTRYL